MQFLVSDREAQDALYVCSVIIGPGGFVALRSTAPIQEVIEAHGGKPTPRALVEMRLVVETLCEEVEEFGNSIAMQLPEDLDEGKNYEIDIDLAAARVMIPIFAGIADEHKRAVPDCDDDVCFTVGVSTLLDRLRMATEVEAGMSEVSALPDPSEPELTDEELRYDFAKVGDKSIVSVRDKVKRNLAPCKAHDGHGHFCTRPRRHRGVQHVAEGGGKVRAVWPVQ